MTAATLQVMIERLRTPSALHYLNSQHSIVTDNGSVFTNKKFTMKTQFTMQRVLHSYHHASNGLSERDVQTLKKGQKSYKSVSETKLTRFLIPHATTGWSLA